MGETERRTTEKPERAQPAPKFRSARCARRRGPRRTHAYLAHFIEQPVVLLPLLQAAQAASHVWGRAGGSDAAPREPLGARPASRARRAPPAPAARATVGAALAPARAPRAPRRRPQLALPPPPARLGPAPRHIYRCSCILIGSH